ncbi:MULTISPECIES: enoyl-CoA-hydratase DpgB [Streptomyces]|uniref:Enoyl-CoA hydratase/isomerase family protein n=1 Tax=Streptomyces tsukubensis (strain DSM 42081 / NBRC 108919 / NRRL 18488 / 9993) TaxID=1114943 RepID=I2MTB2_STRT9|nr:MULTISPECIES: enoyl-CoA-hydratase DpgB [Streptomyces]AZK92605.1 enoyl-CoA hydratase [Streptomyces tsukubensis]EIF88009.1 enoyl-CoA hydratase [Streptomyces tsukubensis NRRL18488]MYS64026.1 enoyl-CoA hydratase/isomerase family protein [Streptomyces sp. SID5473]QKM71219.1 enoyl-CoA hydratase/isomerase family protein [Streptomyces tsukubensis NRRL18488]TAI40383.1 enoyl-CoA hydratase/isomerase family protein [Streptomyces tsukubensis]
MVRAAEKRLRIDGRRPPTADTVAAIGTLCDGAEDSGGPGPVVIEVSGTPESGWTGRLTVGLVNKWERALRRLERLPVTTIAVADGDCGGPALDVLLTADIRIAAPSVRLLPPVVDGATWPGMALHRLAQQTSGTAAVRRAALYGTPLDAARARALHLLDEVTDDPAAAVAKAAERTAPFAGPELAIRRQLLLDARTVPFEEALGAHLAACDRVLRRSTGEAAT